MQSAKLLRVHVSESDRYGGKPLHEAIVARCRELQVAGATVFRGVEGYGESAGLHHARLVGGDCPLVITIVDTPEKLAALVPEIERMMHTGLLAMSDVHIIRVRKESA